MLHLSTTTCDRLKKIPWFALGASVESLDAALSEVLTGRPAERVLDRYLRAHRGFSAEERTAAAEAIFGVGLWRRRLAYQVGSEDPRLLLFGLLRDVAGLTQAEASDIASVSDAPPVKAPPERLADFYSLPDWLEATLIRELGQGVAEFCDAIARPGPICLRANTLRTTRDALLAELARNSIPAHATPLAPHAVILEGRANLLGLDIHRLGHFEAQDEGSQLLVELVDARPGQRVLDLCAGAGGKTLALAAAMRNEGALYAYDIDGERLDRLLQRGSRAGVNCVRILRPGEFLGAGGTSTPLRSAQSERGGAQFDRVLVDAPCSELGVLRRGPDLRFRLNPADFASLPPLQLQLLNQGASCVRSGGRLVYATCTLRREENEEVAGAFQAAHPEFQRVPQPGADGYFRVYPHVHNTDGFFAAVYTRN